MGVILDVVKAAINNARHRPVTSVLPPESWFVRPGRLRFGMPWPWEEIENVDQVVATAATSEDPHEPTAEREIVGGVTAPRATGSALFLLWSTEGEFEPVPPDVAVQLGRAYGGWHRGLRRIRLGADRAILVDVDVPGGDRVRRLVAGWGPGHLLHGEFRVPAAAAPGYAPHLDTMLATWTWG